MDDQGAQFGGVKFEPLGGERPTDARELLARAARILADNGHESGLAGQVTARGPEPETYWTLPLGMGLDEALAESFVLVDGDLKTLQGKGRPNPATRFHLWVYRARTDVQSIIHTHPPYASALAAAALALMMLAWLLAGTLHYFDVLMP